MRGFFPRERAGEDSWQWMGTDAAWTVINTTSRAIVATLGAELSAVSQSRRLDLRLDGRQIQSVVVGQSRRTYELGPVSLTPGPHDLTFHAVETPTAPGDVTRNGDRRALSFAFGTWNWTVMDQQR
ncbi:MAG: hypothetical protein H0U19_12440 [Acidobacteria bacterium]|nr:hypothetical protein [Acidobacteriota bacterium]